jgi:hypothetical protein
MDALETSEGRAEPDRRGASRFPVVMQLEYKVFRHSEFVCQGVGRTVNISSGGVLFRADRPLERDYRVELSIEWPLPHARSAPLRLHALCEIVRTEGGEAAVRMMRHDFRMGPAAEEANGDG